MRLAVDNENKVPDEDEIECIAKELSKRGLPIFAGEVRALWRKKEELDNLYSELVLQVSMKVPGETRHETALRYLRGAESRDQSAAQCEPQKENEG